MTKEEQVDPTVKVVVVGNANTGKTSWVTRLTKNTFKSPTKRTNGIDYCTHELKINDQAVNCHVWDLAGVLKYRVMARCASHDASCVFLVYDITNRRSFENCVEWLKEIDYSSDSKLKVMLIGNKSDLAKSRVVSTEEAHTFSTDNDLLFMETSALNGDHVVLAFQQMIIALLDNNRQETPFQVVLIDRRSAANGHIHCVKKPLQGDLQFVALSYRWGELQESMVDTNLGYIAKITSFRLEDFYGLCKMMEHDPDLEVMDYVWVDAICVDQSNYERRKATIYHMSDIYEHANHILAVPDLHLQHLKEAFINTQKIISNNIDHMEYLYNVFHNNFERLSELDDLFLDDIGFPKNTSMRKWLTMYTDYFTAGFTKYVIHNKRYDPVSALEHLCETTLEVCQSSRPNTKHSSFNPADARHLQVDYDTHYCSKTKCPFDWYRHIGGAPWKTVKQSKDTDVSGYESMAYNWSRRILDRGTQIRQGIEHFMSLINDWSTRAWVISEINIAKKKNNLKYWFIQFPENKTLSSDRTVAKMEHSSDSNTENKASGHRLRPMSINSFYKFDFDDYTSYSKSKPDILEKSHPHEKLSKPACQEFHSLMLEQLGNQDFFEMMLKSKASRNEDRFYAVFPSSPYKDELRDRDAVSSWNIQSMVSVKLKLYELMTTADKLNLFFLSGHWNSANWHPTSPTFATSTVYWQDDRVDYPPVSDFYDGANFDVDESDAIRLVPPIGKSSSKYCLNVKPKQCCMLNSAARSKYLFKRYPGYKQVCKRLQINSNIHNVDIVFIPQRLFAFRDDLDYWFYNCVSLIGNMAANKWEIHKFILEEPGPLNIPTEWEEYWFGDLNYGFNIY